MQTRLRLAEHGRSTQDISGELDLSEGTVRNNPLQSDSKTGGQQPLRGHHENAHQKVGLSPKGHAVVPRAGPARAQNRPRKCEKTRVSRTATMNTRTRAIDASVQAHGTVLD